MSDVGDRDRNDEPRCVKDPGVWTREMWDWMRNGGAFEDVTRIPDHESFEGVSGRQRDGDWWRLEDPVEGVVLGYGCLSGHPDNEATIAVNPAVRRARNGKRILRALEAAARTKGHRALLATIRSENPNRESILTWLWTSGFRASPDLVKVGFDDIEKLRKLLDQGAVNLEKPID